ncbi:serine/threonine-protein kinase rio1 [Trifolium repens]|nr:serine/threonine-protein kinase rio1 [Trifolium repens]
MGTESRSVSFASSSFVRLCSVLIQSIGVKSKKIASEQNRRKNISSEQNQSWIFFGARRFRHCVKLKFSGCLNHAGKDGWAAPRLEDANLSFDKLRKGYVEIIVAMPTLYQNCRLVHGDLSEYNILYYIGHLYIIDVSQAVDPDLPRALKFLIEDCIDVSDFFKRYGKPITVTALEKMSQALVSATVTTPWLLDLLDGPVVCLDTR